MEHEADRAAEPVWTFWRIERVFNLTGINPEFPGHPTLGIVTYRLNHADTH
jgi:hypothetical protein